MSSHGDEFQSVPSSGGSEPMPAHAASHARWQRILRGVLRLAFVRRLWGVLGGWLRQVKQRGECPMISGVAS